MSSRFYRLKLLLLPSVLSSAVCCIIASFTLVITAWSFISERQLFYDYLFGVYGFNTLLVQGHDGLWVLRQAILNSNATYYILILVCSLLVGLLVYALLEGIRFAKQQTTTAWRELHMPGSVYSQAAHRDLARHLLRVVGLIGWALYSAVFVTILLPTALVLTRAGADSIDLAMASGWVSILQGFLLLAVSLHVHVVFIRLVALRPRLFGDTDIEIAQSG